MIFVSVELVEALHKRMIDEYGGSHGLRDRGLLESAVARAENRFTYDESATLAEVAASLAWGLIKNHAFIDGNKRTGFAAMQTLVELNECWLTCTEVEETHATQQVAAGEMTEDEWAAWCRGVIVKQT